MENLNIDLCHYILSYLKLKDKCKMGKLNRRFNWMWNNYLAHGAVRITEGYRYMQYRFILLINWMKLRPYIGILNKCKRYFIMKPKITMEYIYLSHDERQQFSNQSNNYI
jgi:hypothetical protein